MVRVVVEQRKALKTALEMYARSKPCELIPKGDNKATLHISKVPPIEISILSGEILYHCRSALDHLFLELVKRHGIPTKKDWLRHCQFPLAMEPANFPGQFKDWVSVQTLTFVERLQPYRTGNEANRLLWYLAKLSNIDKHRNLSTTVARVDVHDSFSTVGGGINVKDIRPMLQDGAELPITATLPDFYTEILAGAMDVQRQLIPVVAFDEPEIGRPETSPVEGIVYQLPTLVSSYIIPAVNNLLSNP